MNPPVVTAILGTRATRWSKTQPSFGFVAVENSAQIPPSAAAVICDHADTLSQLKTQQPQLLAILWVDPATLTAAQLRQALIQCDVFQVLSADDPPAQIAEVLDRARARSEADENKRHLLTVLKAKNNQLQQLTTGLEQAIVERTQGVADSKAQVERQLTKVNELIRFVKDLSFQRGLEDLLMLMQREVRGFHGVFETFLLCHTPQGDHLYHYRGGGVIERDARHAWEPAGDGGRQYLANELGRPMGRIHHVALRGSPHAIFFEHSLDAGGLQMFSEFLNERLQSFALALDRLLFEADLKTASLLWEQTFDGIEEPVAILDQDYQLLRANRYFTTDFILSKCFGHFAGLNAPCRGCPLPVSRGTGAPATSQVRRNHQVYDVHAYPITFEDRATGFVNHYVDVTKSLDLQGQVVQSEKMAAVGQMAGHIAHELNNPLAGIRGLVQILLHTLNGPASLAEDLREVERAAMRCHAIIENLQQFSSDRDLRGSVVDFNEVVSRTMQLLKTAMTPFYHEIELHASPLWVRAAPQLLQQVVFNLVMNACQAMGQAGDLHIRLSAHEGLAQFEVADSGGGIAADVQDRIFTPFFTTKPPGAGTGLGLSICRNIVEAFKGQIFFESKPGVGTHFFVRLPLEAGDMA